MKKLALCLVLTGLAVSILMSGLVAVPVQASVSTDWAVLIAGGGNAAGNKARFWNNIGEMYEILTDTFGYAADAIFVLYADGDSPHYMNCDDPGNVEEYPIPGTPGINFLAATLDNLDMVTDAIAASGHDGDTLFVFTTDHGADDGSGSLVLWGEGETVSPEDFAGPGYMGKITQYSWRAFLMSQCHSGAFVDQLSGERTLIAASCRYDEWAYPHPEEEPWVWRYSEFCFHFSAALKGADAYGAAVDADVNNDGKVSFVEAFNYAQSEDCYVEGVWDDDKFCIEHPQYDDNGDDVPHEGQMPAGGDGSLGSGVFVGPAVSVTGRVTDRSTGNPGDPIAGAQVKAYQAGILKGSDTTDSNGRYEIRALLSGIYLVTASRTGFNDLTYAAYVSYGVPATKDFPLEPRTGGGGCPFLQVWDGGDYVDEGFLDIHNAEGVDVTYEHMLMTMPEWVNGCYVFRLTEHPVTISDIDQVQLRAVLEDGTVREFPLVSAQHSEYGSVLDLLHKSDDRRAEERGADYNDGISQSIDLKFAALGPQVGIVGFIFTIEGNNMICKTCV